jgi:hypothetical protein
MPAPIYSTVTVESVEYEQENNFAGQGDTIGSLPPESKSLSRDFDFFDSSVFAVGIHAVDPAIGSGDATNLDSLIGLKILEPGSYTDVEVPIFPAVVFPELTDIQQGQTFPPNPNGETEVRAAIWEALSPSGLDEVDQPDNADDVPDDPFDLVDPFAVSAPATISDLDQSPTFEPTDSSTPTAIAMNLDNRLDDPIASIRVDEAFGGPTLATLTGDPLPIPAGTTQVRFEDIAVVGAGTTVEIVALDSDGNTLDTDTEDVSDGGELDPNFGSF